jgi:TonB family protein
LLLLLPLLVRPLPAQHVLVAEDDGQMFLVCGASGAKPRVRKEGKIVLIDPRGFALREVPEFLPAYVTVSNVNVRTTFSSTRSGPEQVNNDFYFDADFETGYRLTDVFVVVALETERAGNTLFLWEVGTLEPNKVKGVSIIVPMDSPIGSGHYNVRLFSGGAELFQSLLPFGESESALNRMVASRIKDVHNAAPKFFFGPTPEYPPGLKKANLKGQAIVSIRIGVNGDVYDPSVKSATDPAFGEAALRSVRQWRFLPRVKDDYPVETKADVPVFFSQPKPPADNS